MLALSILISKDVLDQYGSKSTSFKQFEEKLTDKESATLVLGLWPLKNMNYTTTIPYQSYKQWKMGKDFTLSFGVVNYKTAQEKIELQEDIHHLEISHSSIGKVQFNKLVANFGDFYKITANIIRVKAPFWLYLNVNFADHIAEKDIPNVDIFLSTEMNAYGVTMYNWLDGKRITLNKVKGFKWMEIQPTKVINLKSKSKCSETGFYNCFYSNLSHQNYDSCSKKCLSISTFDNAMPICETVEEFQCSHNITVRLKENSKCLPACTQIHYGIEYEYQEDSEMTNASRNVTFAYRISKLKLMVEEEYLVHDFVNMLGSIGGTFGLFVGFSFLTGISHLLQYIQVLIVRLTSKNLNKIVDGKRPKHIKAMPQGGQDQKSKIFHRSDISDLILRIEKIEGKLLAWEFVTKTVTNMCKEEAKKETIK